MYRHQHYPLPTKRKGGRKEGWKEGKGRKEQRKEKLGNEGNGEERNKGMKG